MTVMAARRQRRRYAGGTRPVMVKQRVKETSVAHPERVEATSKTGEATVMRFDGDSDHGGADFIDDGVSATAVGKMTKEEWIKYHSIEMKL